MELSKIIFAEFEHEMNTTRRFFESVSERIFHFTPHKKSKSVELLVNHMVPIPGWVPLITDKSELDWSTQTPPTKVTSAKTILQVFDENVKLAKMALADTNDKRLSEDWAMKNGDKLYFSGPKYAALRNIIINHTIHHRAQLGMYLRLSDVKVPASYIASADDSLI